MKKQLNKVAIYKYTNKTNKKVYIGQSINIRKRKWEHEHGLNSQQYIDKSIRKYGINNFDFQIIEYCDVNKADERERYWIKYYNSYENGYNQHFGGQNQIGENNKQAKLSEKQVLEIIELLKQNNKNNHDIAKEFNVSNSTIDDINRCLSWTHLHNYKNNIRNEFNNQTENILRGEKNPCNKNTESQVLTVIDMLKTTDLSCPEISKLTNVSLNSVYDINRCKTWKYLHNYKKNIRKEYKEGDNI